MSNIKNVQIGEIYLRGGVYHLVVERVYNVANEMYYCSLHGGEYDIDSLISSTDFGAMHLTGDSYQLVGSVSSEQQKEALANFRHCRLEYLQSLRKSTDEYEEEQEKNSKSKKPFHNLISKVYKIGKR